MATYLDKADQDKLAGVVQLMLEDDLKYYPKHYFRANVQATSDIKIWSPSRWFLRSIFQQGINLDSQGNIHGLAVLAL
ncbi:hypothetical protein N7537_006584 [Penicillium hordei]|uniref:Uncharacterized protein n=1 Tax=Penicillium hordei TaxID=40994 RepID=A0AAD6E7W0_9EURO|nr:uncharacterized protein N7537_006584 [Penicillium hordei]KAJ5603628.1 hypothetical protein N7537_006584 [Penicillium hordei]